MKSLSVQPQVINRYEIIETPQSYFVHVKSTAYKPGKAVGIVFPWWLIGVIAFAITLIAILLSGNAQPKQAVLATESPPAIEEVTQAFSSSWETTGFLFPDSDVRYLTASDIMVLTEIDGWSMASLAQMAINEIYARHNYLFNSEEILSFFDSYSWYNGYLSAEESAASFNKIEWANISYLKDIKESNM